MYAIVRSGGRQHRVAVGDVLAVDRLAASAGSTVPLTPVLLVDGGTVTATAEALAGVAVEAEVLGEVKAKKIVIATYKNKTGHHRRLGHRQLHTRVRVTDIRVGNRSAADETAAAAAAAAVAKVTAADEAAAVAADETAAAAAAAAAPAEPEAAVEVAASDAAPPPAPTADVAGDVAVSGNTEGAENAENPTASAEQSED